MPVSLTDSSSERDKPASQKSVLGSTIKLAAIYFVFSRHWIIQCLFIVGYSETCIKRPPTGQANLVS